ncbi:MAG: ImmA/IrrE family metallo-endopeptidase [Clostridia bacterium]|nr:ImmA/IrrE family metallo-endopeptidase [Clostridia bacterium]
MTTYEELLDEASQDDVLVLENVHFESRSNGLINGKVIGLSDRLETSIEKACTTAEEMGHFHTTVGNILDPTKPENRKQEHTARLWAYNRMITLDKLIAAWEHGCRNRYEIAEHLEVTEAFLQEAINSYRSKIGISIVHGNYLVTFEPVFNIRRLVWMHVIEEG